MFDLVILKTSGIGRHIPKSDRWSGFAGERFRCCLPASVLSISRWQYRLKRRVLVGSLLSTLLMPLTGMLYSGASGLGFQLWGWVSVDWLDHDTPAAANQAVAAVIGSSPAATAGLRGRSKQAQAPVIPSLRFVRVNSPPSVRAICRQSARPMPWPFGLVV